MKKTLLFLALLLPVLSFSQNTATVGVLPDNGAALPSTCRIGQIYFQTAAGGSGIGLYTCTAANTWTSGGGGGGGSVTSFSAGNLSPLFTSSVATSTTTPALTFSLSNFAADSLFMNATGSSAAPSATTMPTCTSGADLYNTSTHSWSCVAVGGGGSNIIPVTLGATQGPAGCSLTGSFPAATGPTCVVVAGSSTLPQRGIPQFTTAGVIGTGTGVVREVTLPSNYTANANLVLHLEVSCPTGTSNPVNFSAEYADTALSGQPTFVASPVASTNMSAAAWPTTVTGTITMSPTASPGDQFFYQLYLTTDTGSCHPYVSKEYWTF